MTKQPLTILDFIRHVHVLNEQSISPAQRTCLKVIYGLPLEETELEIYRRATGRETYLPKEHNEATIIVGRRGGKTSRIAAPIVCYEASRDHRLPKGEQAYVMLIARVKNQAQIAFRQIRHYLLNSPVLGREVVKVRQHEIVLRNGITIACYPCSHIAVRGESVVAVICDEMAFWQHEETAANPEEEVLAALRPAMATFPNAKLIKISTPYRKEGILWQEFQQRAELDHLVWQLPSPEMNPTLQPHILEKMRRRSEEKFRREFLAEFTDNIAGWIVPEVLDPCIIPGRSELPRVRNATYVAAVDPALKGNDFALAILHRQGEGPLVVDRVARWTGSKKAPLGYEWVCEEIARLLKDYRINRVMGDQHCAVVISQHFLKLGIKYEECTFGTHTRAELFGNLKHLLIQRKVELLNEPTLLRQFRSLEERKTARGQIDIRPRSGTKDDLAVAIALAARELSNRRSRRITLTLIGPQGPRPPALSYTRTSSVLDRAARRSAWGLG
jgi:hypothetical protein